MATYIYSPLNEFGKALVPVGMTKTKAKVSESEFIDISWIDTISEYAPGKQDANSKVVLYPALQSAVEHALANSITQFKFKVLDGVESLPENLSESTIKNLKTTIYLVAVKGQAEENNKYVEYVCSNTEKYDEVEKTEVPAEYEQLGSINYVLEQATGDTLGGVRLSDTGNEAQDASSGYAATPKAIHDLQQQIDNKATTFTLNGKNVTEGTTVTISGTDPVSVETTEEEEVAVKVSVQDASESAKGVAKLYNSAETGAEATDGSLTGKATADAIKVVDDKVAALKIPEIVTDTQTITEGKVTIEGVNIVLISAFIENDMFIPQVEQTGESCVLTFFTAESEKYNNETQVTLNYIKKPTA